MCKMCHQHEKIENMSRKIESLREKLDKIAEKESFILHKKRTYHLSTELDRLITEYTREMTKTL
ncbi:MAG: aspartyl-phosphate phosphatase Spo0E family protein [Candidatus Syntrophonatronum acetioxidans]|uniref:Aspartyl-phosphate phosphatase Spo0E family protein n=1 Tax=Candidatus Syntrophonatronum acetioxidans TaxID=1795816 RepID=A0A424YIV5_9FIRM|nr:MAG: aspartyl-phosphate phosphatase Spo0E family protein [Candidatus Syntrophonatronum acetioxidans]